MQFFTLEQHKDILLLFVFNNVLLRCWIDERDTGMIQKGNWLWWKVFQFSISGVFDG